MGMGSGVGGSGKGGGQITNTATSPFNTFGILGPVISNVFGNAIKNASPQKNPQGNFDYTVPEQSNPYNVDYAKYTAQPTGSNVSGEAFNNGVNSDSGIAAILAGLYNSGVFNQQNLNPYAPQGTVGSFTGIPYGQQQESMFARKDLNGHNPYGGYQGQSWNPYGNYYTAGNTSTTNGVAPPPRTTGPDALQQLNFMMNQGNTQI